MQVNNETDQVQEEQPKEKPLSREQQRKKDRIEKGAEETFELLSNRFLDYFVNHDDPEGNEVAQKLSQVSAQWKAYCAKRQLVDQAKSMIDVYGASVLKDYNESKYPKVDDPVQA